MHHSIEPLHAFSHTHQGVSAGQDGRFTNKEKKLIAETQFPPEFDEKVDMQNVDLDVLKPWIAERFTECLDGFEDEIMLGYALELLEKEVR